MGIPDGEVKLVRDSVDIVALVGEQVALRRVGRSWTGLCPFHPEKSPSFSVSQENGFYYCFGCHAHGDAITFLRETEHLDFVEAVESLAKRCNITLHPESDPASAKKRQQHDRLIEILGKAASFYHEQLLKSPSARSARDYLRSRGFSGEVAREFKLGWAPMDSELVVKELGAPLPLLVDAGLGFVDRRGRFVDAMAGRVIFPILDQSGRNVAFGGRIVPGVQLQGAGANAKYKNSKETLVYSKSSTLYALNWAKASVVRTGVVIVCEGYTDVMGCSVAGMPNAVATCGTALAEEHFTLIKRFARKIVLAFDSDTAGAAGAARVYRWESAHDVEVFVASLPDGSDPSSLAQSDPGGLRQAIEQAKPFLAFQLDRLLAGNMANPEGRAKALSVGVNMIAQHPNELVRHQYLMMLADRCRVPEDMAREQLQKELAPKGPRNAKSRRDEVREQSVPARPERVFFDPRSVPRPEMEALRLAVQEPLLAGDIFRIRGLFESDEEVEVLNALEAADGDVKAAAGLLREELVEFLVRASVEPPLTSVAEVVYRIIDTAVERELNEMRARVADGENFEDAARTISVLRRAKEDLKDPGRSEIAKEALIGWFAERSNEA